MIKTTTNEMITNLIESMTVDEMKERLAQYMQGCGRQTRPLRSHHADG